MYLVFHINQKPYRAKPQSEDEIITVYYCIDADKDDGIKGKFFQPLLRLEDPYKYKGNDEYIIKGPFRPSRVLTVQFSNGNLNDLYNDMVHITPMSGQEKIAAAQAYETFAAAPAECIERDFPFKRKVFQPVDPETWRAAGRATISSNASFVLAVAASNPNPAPKADAGARPTSKPILPQGEWLHVSRFPEYFVTEAEAKKSNARKLDRNQLRHELMFPGPGTFKFT